MFRYAVLLTLSLALATAQEPKYEMTTYAVGFLKKGPNWSPEPTEESKKIQAGHMAHIQAMAKEGKLLLAGPFSDGGDPRGLFVFREGISVDDARKLAEQDPAVKSGRLTLEVRPWYSAKGIQIVTSK